MSEAFSGEPSLVVWRPTGKQMAGMNVMHRRANDQIALHG
jgi:hypothetical protein